MNRKEALSLITIMFGGTIAGGHAFLSGCSRSRPDTLLDEDDMAFLNEVGETILPETSASPGAKAADVGRFMNTIVTDFYTDEEAAEFRGGIFKINGISRNRHGNSFVRLAPEQRHAVLLELETEASDDPELHYYTMMKQLSIWGYLTSEVTVREAFNYHPNPGRFQACLHWEEGDKVMYPRISGDQAKGYAVHHMVRKPVRVGD